MRRLLLPLVLVFGCAQGPRGYGTVAPKKTGGTTTPTGGGTGTGGGTSKPPPPADLGPALEVAAGGHHACVRRQTGAVQCWGRGGSGELGDGNFRDNPRPVLVADLADAAQIAAGDQHTCARQTAGTVVCWGSNASGQLGDGEGRPGAQSARPVAVKNLGDAVDVRAGKDHTCALRRSGGAVCWGDNRSGQSGGADRQVWVTPAAIAALPDAVELAPGASHTCARTRTGKVACWGSGAAGQLGDGSPRRTSPAAVPGLADAIAVASGHNHTCALRKTGTAVCWGAGYPRAPTAVPVLKDAVELAAGDDHTCARSKGALLCWGRNDRGQLGDGTLEDRAGATLVRGVGDVRHFAAAARLTCAVTRGGGVYCWGANDFGALGAGLLPSAGDSDGGVVRNVTGASDLASGDGFSCAVADGGVQCWGAGGLGQLGDGTLADRSLAGPASGLGDAVQVAAGTGHACARRSSGQVACWGQNSSGQLGDGTRSVRSTPVPVQGLADAALVAAGDQHTCAARKSGGVVCWGKGASGQLGQGKKEDSARPVAVAGSGSVTSLSLGTGHSCAVTAGRSVLCWGGNFFGQVGSGHTVGFPELLQPQKVVKVDDAVEVALGDDHSCARRSTGQVACWGKGDVGQLGANVTSNWSTRVPVTGLTSATALSAGRGYACAATPSAVMCWGDDRDGQLGDGAKGGYSRTPVAGQRVGDAVRLAAGHDHVCAVRSGGRVVCWGSNSRGQLGDGTTAQALAPIAVVDIP
ncbi:MAG: hypothetical protein JNL82_21040 [Myxococcales bacterium]|nr:hypothetical protein [Myxococcales bacterium]